jgi:hypothetical protein
VLATSATLIGTFIIAPLVFLGLVALAVRLLRGKDGSATDRRR